MRNTHTKIWAAAAVLGLAPVTFAQGRNSAALRGMQITASDQALVKGYWTTDRLVNAKPMALPRIDSVAAAASATPPATSPTAPKILPGTLPTITAGRRGSSAVSERGLEDSQPILKMANHAEDVTTSNFTSELPFNNYQVPDVNMYPYSAVGKLFFVVPPGASVSPGEYVCTGSVFYDSHTVLTARHCLYDYSTGTWYTNFVFYPAFHNGPNPAFHNGWTVRAMMTWASNAATMDYDIGLLQLNDAAGYGCNGSSGTLPIWSYTGSLGVRFFGNASEYTTIQEDVLGYPQESPFSGDNMYQDVAIVGAINPLGTTNIIALGNPQTGGSSGGPWIVGLDPGDAANGTNNTINATNLITGLNSFHWTDPNQPLAMNGPAFLGYNLWNLYTAYSQMPCQ
jgi:V8-like Glu-specific endopeptidase